MTPDSLSQFQQHLLQQLTPAPQEARRLFHGRGRCWPGLEQITVDWLEAVLWVSVFRELPEDALNRLIAVLQAIRQAPECPSVHSLLLQHRYRQTDSVQLLYGELPKVWTIHEHGLSYQLDLGRKQNSGLFLDMRYGRRWVQSTAKGLRVLNLFAYTCGFSVAAIAGGASKVVNLDMARAALNRGRDNHRLNGHDLRQVHFLDHDLFKSWAKVRQHGPYDLLIIDPPSFQKGSFVLSKDYPRVVRRLPELLAPQGKVLACVNDPAVGVEFLLQLMANETPQLNFVQRLENPPEFADIDPNAGLKALVFQAS